MALKKACSEKPVEINNSGIKNLPFNLFFVDSLSRPVYENAQKIAFSQDLLRLSQIFRLYRFFLRRILLFELFNYSLIFR